MRLLAKGYGIQPPEWHVDEPVAAGYSRVYYIESGEAFFKEGVHTIKLPVRSLHIFPASTPCMLFHNVNAPLNCVWFHMDFFPVRLLKLITIDVQEDRIAGLYISLIKEMFSAGLSEDESFSEVIEAFAVYLQKFCLPEENLPMADAVSFIRDNYKDKDLNVNTISIHFGYTTEHFIRTFTKALGITPYKYLLNMRMYEARRLLLENHTVSETAEAVGYENARSFSHAFTKKFDITPNEYRKNVSPIA